MSDLSATSTRDANYALGLLLLVYTSNFVDRMILSVLAQPIKHELGLADWQIGALGGLSFALVYSVLGLPIARLAERTNRVWIIAVATAVWSGMSALCGLAGSFSQLVMFRVGVGIGEAGATPPAHSLISDYFPPRRRATALSIYGLGVPLGSMLGAVVGGLAAQAWGWRSAFFVVGLPGLVLAVVTGLTVREPVRGGWDRATETPATPSLAAVASLLWSRPSFRHLIAGIVLASFGGYAMVAFTASFFIRSFGLDLARAGLVTGIAGGCAAALGTLLGGLSTDAAGRGDRRWYAWIPSIGLLAAGPLYALTFLQTTWPLAALLLTCASVFQYAYLGPTYALMHNMVEPRMRATAAALMLLVVNLVGLGLGPLLAGLLSDALADRAFGEGRALACAAAEGALAARCSAAAATGLGHALTLTAVVFAWAALHYARAARCLRQDLAHQDG